MNVMQHLLCKLAEECNEVGQMALKSAYFGLEQVYKDLGHLNNAERTYLELDDLNAVVEMLNEYLVFSYIPNRERIEAKKIKVEMWMKYSKELGFLKGDFL